MHFGSDEQRRRFLLDGYAGRTRWCLGVTEPEGACRFNHSQALSLTPPHDAAGSDVAALRTTATLSSDGKYYIVSVFWGPVSTPLSRPQVSGSKKWITGGLWADYMTAAVRTGSPTSGASGLSFLVIPLNSPGVKRRRIRVSGLHASGSTFFELNDVKVPVENLIGKAGDGFRMIMANFNPERFNLSIMCIRMARNAVEEAWKHALTRKTFGKPLMSHQIIRAKFGSVGFLLSRD